jgi:cytochrome c-type biogenesis protein CcmH/NrfG
VISGTKEDVMKKWVMVLLMLASPVLAAEAPAAGDSKERAVSSLELAVKNDPQNAELWGHLGFAYRKLDRLDAARDAFEKASSIDPQNRDALYMLGLIYEKDGRKQDALRVWKQYLTLVTDPEKRNMAENHIHHLSQ